MLIKVRLREGESPAPAALTRPQAILCVYTCHCHPGQRPSAAEAPENRGGALMNASVREDLHFFYEKCHRKSTRTFEVTAEHVHV